MAEPPLFLWTRNSKAAGKIILLLGGVVVADIMMKSVIATAAEAEVGMFINCSAMNFNESKGVEPASTTLARIFFGALPQLDRPSSAE